MKILGTKNLWQNVWLVKQNFGPKKSKVQKKGKKIMAKISSVTTKTFLILTKVASTNVAWTNVTANVGIC